MTKYCFTVHLSGGQSIRHFKEFDTQEEYDKWVRSRGFRMVSENKGPMALENPYVFYKAEHMTAVEFESPASEPGIRFI